MKVIAGIVLYNADPSRLKENIKGIISQVDEVVLFDNGSQNIRKIEKILYGMGDFHLIKSKKNRGIAYALNRIAEFSIKKGFTWLLTLDQDSVAYSGLVKEYEKYLTTPHCGQLSCINVDRKLINQGKKFNSNIREVKECMTSGSLINLVALEKVGGYNEALFIDWVDTELCYEMRAQGYKTYQINYKGILHELGNVKYHKFFSKNIPVYNYSAMRKFYYTRNSIYMSKRYPKAFNIHEITFINIKNVVKAILYEKNKMKCVEAIISGTIKGYKIDKSRKNYILKVEYGKEK